MREKILAELRKKYPGLSAQFLGLWADKLGTKVTEEAQIEGVVSELEKLPVSLQDLATEFQKEGDRRVTTAKQEWDKKNPPKQDDPKPDPTKDNPSDDTPVWAKKQNELLTALTAKVQSLESKETQKTLSKKLEEKLTEKKIPLVLAKGRTVEKEEDLEALVTELEESHLQYKQALVNEGFNLDGPPKNGSGPSGNNKEASKEEIDAAINEIM